MSFNYCVVKVCGQNIMLLISVLERFQLKCQQYGFLFLYGRNIYYHKMSQELSDEKWKPISYMAEGYLF